MSARFKNVCVYVCFLFLCISANPALAEKPDALEEKADKKVTEDNQAAIDDQTSPPLVLEFSSVFDDYLSYDDIPDIGWKEANENVGEIGGWRAYANLVQEEARMKAELEAQKDEAQELEAQKDEAQEEDAQESEGDQ